MAGLAVGWQSEGITPDPLAGACVRSKSVPGALGRGSSSPHQGSRPVTQEATRSCVGVATLSGRSGAAVLATGLGGSQARPVNRLLLEALPSTAHGLCCQPGRRQAPSWARAGGGQGGDAGMGEQDCPPHECSGASAGVWEKHPCPSRAKQGQDGGAASPPRGIEQAKQP